MENNFDVLIRKLDEFIRKYYKNQLIRGGLYALAVVLAFYIAVNLLEYFAYFGSVVRAVMFWSFIVINLFILYRLVFIPLFRLYRIGKILTYEQAARVIGQHFGEVQDTLLNTLQLQEMKTGSARNIELMEASINQKIARLRPVPFAAAVDLRKNRKYLKFALPPLLILIILLVVSPGIITGPSARIIDYRTFYEKPAPFRFVIMNNSLEALQQEDFVLNVKIDGQEVPDNVFIMIGEAQYRLNKENNVLFHYTFKNLRKNTAFYLIGDNFRSRDYEIKVIPRPIILNFEIDLNYPAYVQKKDEVLQNSGDIVVPEGTRITWSFNTRDTKKILLRFAGKEVALNESKKDLFIFSLVCRATQNYSIATLNEFFRNKDSMQYSLNVVPDMYPGIAVEEFRDSVYEKRLYFSGTIKDDYGCSRMQFVYRVLPKGEESVGNPDGKTLAVPINTGTTQQQFYYYFDLGELNIEPGDAVEYYFEVWDNDGVNGSKASRSQKLIFKAPSEEEIEKQSEKSEQQLKDQMEDAIRQTQQLQKELEKLDKKMMDKKALNWQEKKQIQDLIDKQQELQNQIEQIKENDLKFNISEQQFGNVDPVLKEKQQQLEKLFNEVMTEEMKELFKQLQEMLEKLDKDKVNDVLDKMKLTNEDMEKALNRNLELFKQLELEKRLNDAIDKLDKLADEQKQLSNETKNENNDVENIKNDQEELNKKFGDVRSDLKKIEEKNKELEQPKDIKNTDEQQNQIQQDMQNSSDMLQKNKKGGASQSQKKAGDEMEQLANELRKMKEEMEKEEYEEDINALRQILDNLVSVSFDQEALMNKLATVNVSDPRYVKMMDNQKELKDEIGMIKDSLYALSKRQPLIEAYVNREMNIIEDNTAKAIQGLHDRNVPGARTFEQYVMTGVNNLALLLAETLDKMNQQMQSQCNSNCKKGGKCKKPGNGKPNASSMKQLQEELNKKMSELKKQMDGMIPGKQGKGQQSMSEQLARMAAQQEALRRMMQQYGEEDKKEGGQNSGNINKMIKDMEETEKDLVNKRLSNETMRRQQEILTRLLESEKAEKERELDQKRESQEGKNTEYSNPNEFFKYNKVKSKEIELLKSIPPTLKSFYKQKVNEYFYNFAE